MASYNFITTLLPRFSVSSIERIKCVYLLVSNNCNPFLSCLKLSVQPVRFFLKRIPEPNPVRANIVFLLLKLMK